jgi:hypothetical protein
MTMFNPDSRKRLLFTLLFLLPALAASAVSLFSLAEGGPDGGRPAAGATVESAPALPSPTAGARPGLGLDPRPSPTATPADRPPAAQVVAGRPSAGAVERDRGVGRGFLDSLVVALGLDSEEQPAPTAAIQEQTAVAPLPAAPQIAPATPLPAAPPADPPAAPLPTATPAGQGDAGDEDDEDGDDGGGNSGPGGGGGGNSGSGSGGGDD